MRLNALEIAVLLQRLGERGKRLVHRVGRDGADGTAEHIRLDQSHARQQVGLEQSVGFVVVIKLQQERIGHIHLQLAQIVEGELEVSIGFSAQRHRAEVSGVVANLTN